MGHERCCANIDKTVHRLKLPLNSRVRVRDNIDEVYVGIAGQHIKVYNTEVDGEEMKFRRNLKRWSR